MKKITITIKPTKVDTVLEELQTVKGIRGLSIIECQGFDHITNIDETELLNLQHYTKIEVIVHNELVEAVHHIIVESAHTGFTGDGSIVVSDINSMFAIATKEFL